MWRRQWTIDHKIDMKKSLPPPPPSLPHTLHSSRWNLKWTIDSTRPFPLLFAKHVLCVIGFHCAHPLICRPSSGSFLFHNPHSMNSIIIHHSSVSRCGLCPQLSLLLLGCCCFFSPAATEWSIIACINQLKLMIIYFKSLAVVSSSATPASSKLLIIILYTMPSQFSENYETSEDATWTRFLTTYISINLKVRRPPQAL